MSHRSLYGALSCGALTALLGGCGLGTVGIVAGTSGGGGSTGNSPSTLTSLSVEDTKEPDAMLLFSLADPEGDQATVTFFYRVERDDGTIAEEVIFKSPRILVVDDNKLIIDLIERALSSRFLIDHALSPAEAFRMIEARPYDLVLLDLVMPETHGLDHLKGLLRDHPGQRVLMTTAYIGDERIEESLAAGAIGWLKKPFKFETLEEKIWQALKAESQSGAGAL